MCVCGTYWPSKCCTMNFLPLQTVVLELVVLEMK